MQPSVRTWVVWLTGLTAYVVAVLHRTSLGVAGLDAAERLHASASVLASFAVLQLLVYAAMQVPVGVLLDRFGSRLLIVIGAVLMSLGQLQLALADTVPDAVMGRVLVGIGDAMTFVSVLRLVTAWFPPRRVPLITQVTGLAGQGGQILSAVPLVALLGGAGWQYAFTSAASLGLLVAVLSAVVVRDVPAGGSLGGAHRAASSVVQDVVSAWRHPGTRLGMWTHFTALFPGTVFSLLWGYPYLISGEGRSPAVASTLFTVGVFTGMIVGPPIGMLTQRHPLRRSWLVIGLIITCIVVWTAVLVWPGRAPLWLLVTLMVAVAMNGPGSMIGFDFARTFNPPNRLGTATGIVNIGGFIASLVTIYLIGVVLDLRTGGVTTYTLGDFRAAMSVQYLVWAVGLAGIVVSRRKVRRRMAAQGIVVPPLRTAVARYRSRRRGPERLGRSDPE